MRRLLALSAACAVWHAPGGASASDMRPRTPPQWDAVPDMGCGTVDPKCLIVVDRSVDPVVHLPYAILGDDLVLDPMLDLPDAHRHQFFAVCRDPGASTLPRWITDFDLQRYSSMWPPQYGPYGASDVLETNTAWEGCWLRITPDDTRIPISCDNAALGLDWDTSGVPVGVYTVYGYTWDPELSNWSRRRGVIKIQDGNDPAAVAPAVAIQAPGASYNEHTLWLTGCLDAVPDTVLRAAWTLQPAGSEVEATPFFTTCVAENGTWAIPFLIPTELGDEDLWIRIEAEDPMGRVTKAYAALHVTDTSMCGGGFIEDPACETLPPPETEQPPAPAPACVPAGGSSGSGTAGTTSASGTSASETTNDPTTPKGCACTADAGRHEGGVAGLLLLALPAAARRRRRVAGLLRAQNGDQIELRSRFGTGGSAGGGSGSVGSQAASIPFSQQ